MIVSSSILLNVICYVITFSDDRVKSQFISSMVDYGYDCLKGSHRGKVMGHSDDGKMIIINMEKPMMRVEATAKLGVAILYHAGSLEI